MTKQIEELIDRIDLIDKRVMTNLQETKDIVDERVTSVLKIDRLVRGFKWNWLLVQIVTLLLVSNCSYQHGVDDTVEWYEEQEEEEIWKAATLNSLKTQYGPSGAPCIAPRRYPTHLQRSKCSMLA